MANTFPCLIVTTTSPYWFHKFSYRSRINASSILFSMSFITVAYFSVPNTFYDHESTNWQLLGVAFGSFGGCMGETSLLALAGRFEGAVQPCIASFSGGTGAAGVFGYFFVLLLHDWCGLKFGWTLMIGNIVAVFYVIVFHRYLTFLEQDN